MCNTFSDKDLFLLFIYCFHFIYFVHGCVWGGDFGATNSGWRLEDISWELIVFYCMGSGD